MVSVHIYTARGTMNMLQTMIKVANTHELSLQPICLYFSHSIPRDNPMQSIWNKAYFYQLNQPKAARLPQVIKLAGQFWAKTTLLLGEGVK